MNKNKISDTNTNLNTNEVNSSKALIKTCLTNLKEDSTLHSTKNIYKKVGALIAALIIGFAGMTLQAGKTQDAENIQQGIAKEIIRFHVLANSDSDEDQALKLKVKDHIVDYMKDLLQETTDIEQTRQIIKSNLSNIEAEAKKIIDQEGYYYSVSADLEQTYFPIKTYGDCTFPAGEYQALRIKIGEAKGQNWWCVLYPNLCFIDATHAVVPDSEKQELKNILTEEEYQSITGESTIKIKFKFLEDFFN